MKIKTTNAFAALRARHAGEVNAKKTHMVRSLNKDGSVSKMALTKSDWQLNAFDNEADAEKRRASLEGLNPGHKFKVVEL